jgi:DNA polymerase-3 subunit gamma/tau
MLSKQAFNALLKTLEEPPAHVIFIFATTEPHKILPTILSRCQRFDFRRISVDEIIGRLRHICQIENISIDDASLHHIARKADGALRDGLGLLDQVIAFCGTTIDVESMSRALNIVSTDRLFETMDCVIRHDTAAGMNLIDTLLAEGYDIQEYLVELLAHLRNLFMARDNQLKLIEAPDDIRQRYQEQAKNFSADDLMRMLHITLQAQGMVKEAQQPRIQIEIALLKLITMDRSESLQKLMAEIAELKQALKQGGAPVSVSVPERTSSHEEPRVEEAIKAAPAPKAIPPKVESPKVESPVAGMKPSPASGDMDEIFATPAIRKSGPSASLTDIQSLETADALEMGHILLDGNLALASAPQIVNSEPSKKILLDDIRTEWAAFADYAREQIPQILFYAIGRSQAIDFQHGEVTVQCEDAFTFKLFEEHRKSLSGLLSTYHEGSLSVKNILKVNDQPSTSDDPYTRFKAMSRENPKLRLIVDLFGAELEY